jgi:hypothetical protein
MRKFHFILGGIIIGLILSFVLMDYEVIKYEIRDQAGIESRWVSEMDFNFVFNASMLVLGGYFNLHCLEFVERKIAD